MKCGGEALGTPLAYFAFSTLCSSYCGRSNLALDSNIDTLSRGELKRDSYPSLPVCTQGLHHLLPSRKEYPEAHHE